MTTLTPSGRRKLPPHLARAKRDLNNYCFAPCGFLPTWRDRSGFDFVNVILMRVWHRDCDTGKATPHEPHQIVTAPRPDGLYYAVECDCMDTLSRHRRCRHRFLFDFIGGIENVEDE